MRLESPLESVITNESKVGVTRKSEYHAAEMQQWNKNIVGEKLSRAGTVRQQHSQHCHSPMPGECELRRPFALKKIFTLPVESRPIHFHRHVTDMCESAFKRPLQTGFGTRNHMVAYVQPYSH